MTILRKNGFTLVELVVVIAIISVLSAIVAPNAYRAIEKSRVIRTISDMKSIKTAVVTYNADTGQWPIAGGGSPIDQNHSLLLDNGVAGWDGPYLNKIGRSPMADDLATGWGWDSGIYMICTKPPGWGAYMSWFDADSNGSYEIKDGISVGVYGLPVIGAIRIDAQVDNTPVNGIRGSMNVINWGGAESPYWSIFLFIGNTGTDFS